MFRIRILYMGMRIRLFISYSFYEDVETAFFTFVLWGCIFVTLKSLC